MPSGSVWMIATVIGALVLVALLAYALRRSAKAREERDGRKDSRRQKEALRQQDQTGRPQAQPAPDETAKADAPPSDKTPR